MPDLDTLLARTWVGLHTGLIDRVSRNICHGFYDGNRLDAHARRQGPVPVVLVIPPMSDVNGALPHPGVGVLQTIARHHGIACEVLNYNLPVNHPRDPYEHLARAIRAWGVRVLGVSTYSQAIRHTLEGLRRIRAEFPDLVIVLGGPHPTESYLSLLGVSFIDYVCRGEAEESFPALLKALLGGKRPAGGSIPGVYSYDRASRTIQGTAASFIDLEEYDRKHLLRYQFSPDELRQQRLYRGCHGTAGPEYWPIALVRGCPYDCTFCAAYQMSGKKLRYRRVEVVADDMEHYLRAYGRRHFSFIDDSFTQRYEYVVDLCREILRRRLRVYWTTDNGIRHETLGATRLVESGLRERNIASVDELVTLMIRAGWRGTAVGLESGSARVRRELVRKGGANLTNEQILENLRNLKQIARREGVYFYINGFLMAGFPSLPLRNGKVVPAETIEEMELTRRFALELRDAGAIDMMNLSMVIPLPGTDMWEALTIEQKLHVLLGCVPSSHSEADAVEQIRRDTLAAYRSDLEATRYQEEPEAFFWRQVYQLTDETQILIMESYDSFNADSAHNIFLDRPAPELLWTYRESVVDDFYGSGRMKARMLQHVWRRSGNLQGAAAYLTLMGRKYEPGTKLRPAAAE